MAVQHTMVPYLWRRHLGIIRSILASLCVLLYILVPVPGGTWIAVIAAVYAAYSVRDSDSRHGGKQRLSGLDAYSGHASSFFFALSIQVSQAYGSAQSPTSTLFRFRRSCMSGGTSAAWSASR